MVTIYQRTSDSIESKSQIIYSNLSKLDASLIRLNESEKYAFKHLINSLGMSDAHLVLVWVKEVEQIRMLRNKIRMLRKLLIKFCEKNQL